MGSDNLDGLESSLNHMDSDELRSEAREMIDDCSKNELKKVLKLLIKISRKSFEDALVEFGNELLKMQQDYLQNYDLRDYGKGVPTHKSFNKEFDE